MTEAKKNFIIKKNTKSHQNQEINHEENVSTQKETEEQGSRIQKENGDQGRKKRLEEKKKQGKKEDFRIT